MAGEFSENVSLYIWGDVITGTSERLNASLLSGRLSVCVHHAYHERGRLRPESVKVIEKCDGCDVKMGVV